MKKEEEEGNFFSREGNESETRQSRSMKFEKESIFMQILNERRKKKERERETEKSELETCLPIKETENKVWKLMVSKK